MESAMDALARARGAVSQVLHPFTGPAGAGAAGGAAGDVGGMAGGEGGAAGGGGGAAGSALERLVHTEAGGVSELAVERRWTVCLTRGAVHGAAGMLLGAALGFVVWRRKWGMLTVFGTGVGVGMGAQKCNDDFLRAHVHAGGPVPPPSRVDALAAPVQRAAGLTPIDSYAADEASAAAENNDKAAA